MVDPVVGSVDDYLVKVLTELGGEVVVSTLDHITIDDKRLADNARDLPNQLFYYSAVHQRLSLRLAQLEIELDTTEARELITISEDYKARSVKITVDELKARVTVSDPIVALRRKIAEVETLKETIQGTLNALRQKGYSLQLIAGIRSKEEDWLKRSFTNRFENHPNRERIFTALKQVIGE